MFRRTFLATAAALGLATTVTVAQQVAYDMDRGVDFHRYRTYTWAPGTPIGDALNDARIVASVERQLAVKGITSAGGTLAPLRVAYHVRFDRSVRVVASSTGFGPYGAGPSRFGTARADRVLVARLAVELVDTATSRVVWHGVTAMDVDLGASPEKRDRQIDKAVARLLKSVPVIR